MPETIGIADYGRLGEETNGGQAGRTCPKHFLCVIDRYAADRQHRHADRSDGRCERFDPVRRQPRFRLRPIDGPEGHVVHATAGLDCRRLSRAVHRLTERRFVTRTRDDGDRRVEHLSLTRQGQAAYDDLRAVAQRYNAALMDTLDPAEAAVLRRALLKLSDVAQGGFT